MTKLPSPYDVFSKPDDDTAWLDQALAEYQRPTSLQMRNFMQLMLMDRYSIQFRKSKQEAFDRVSVAFANKFPH